MTVDTLIVSAAVLAALGWLVARALRRMRARNAKGGGCPGGCGCSGSTGELLKRKTPPGKGGEGGR